MRQVGAGRVRTGWEGLAAPQSRAALDPMNVVRREQALHRTAVLKDIASPPERIVPDLAPDVQRMGPVLDKRPRVNARGVTCSWR
jgi:hypothetical protein